MTSYILILTIIHGTIGAVDVQRHGEFKSYDECAADAVGRIESLRPLYPDAELKWQCEAR